MSKKTYNPGKLWPIIKIALGLAKKNPEMLTNAEYAKAVLKSDIEELNHAETCGNCGASMLEYIFEFDCLDAAMLFVMAKEVRTRGKTMDFTTANQVRVQHLDHASYAMKSRTTQMSKLGLIAKLLGANGRHIPGVWVITTRGWNALKGWKVPKSVRVWRGKIEERDKETITIGEAFNYHRDKIKAIINKGKQPKTDYREIFEDYHVEDWYHFGDVHNGKLL